METVTGTILIVDDDPVCRDMLEQLLEMEGYNLIFATGGKEALVLAPEKCPDLILLDVQMHDIDGFDVCRELRKDTKVSEVPIIMVTGLKSRESLLQMIEAGADDIVYKPYDPVELLSRIRTVMRLDRYRHIVQERSRLSWIMEESDDGYIGLTDDRVITFANPAARNMLDLPEEITGKGVELRAKIAQKGYIQLPEDLFDHGASLEESQGFLACPEDSAAQSVWLQVEIPQLPRAGAGEYIVRLRDVTQQINLQRDLWSFHLIVNHKLRTPLSGLISGTEMIATNAASLPVEQLAYLGEIAHSCSKRLQQQIEQILSYLDTFQGTDVDPLTEQGIADLAEELGKELGCTSTVSCTHGSNQAQQLRLGSSQIEIILRELLSNAVKFHPDRTPHVLVDVTLTDTGLVLSVADDGVQLSPELLSRVWLPYFQAEKNLTGEIPGMGLGLPRIATIVTSVGGTCSIQNRADMTGVQIKITVPTRSAE